MRTSTYMSSFSPLDISNALSVDPVAYERLSQRQVGADTAGERAKLFVELLDVDIHSVDLDFILGYLEAKALVELGVFLLPPPADWPASFPSCRLFVPAREQVVAAEADRTEASTAAAAASAAAQWQPPPDTVATHLAAFNNSDSQWSEVVSFLQSQNVTSLRRLGWVSSFPKKVWGATGDITFASTTSVTAAAAVGGGASTSSSAASPPTSSNKRRRSSSVSVDGHQRQHRHHRRASTDGSGMMAMDEEQEEEEEEEIDEYELEMREARQRKERFLAKLAREKDAVMKKPFMLVDDDVEIDLEVTPLHLRMHGFSADPSSFYTTSVVPMMGQQQQQQNTIDDHRALFTLASLQRKSEVASRRSKLAEGTAVSMYSALDPPHAVLVDWHRTSNLMSANRQQQHHPHHHHLLGSTTMGSAPSALLSDGSGTFSTTVGGSGGGGGGGGGGGKLSRTSSGVLRSRRGNNSTFGSFSLGKSNNNSSGSSAFTPSASITVGGATASTAAPASEATLSGDGGGIAAVGSSSSYYANRGASHHGSSLNVVADNAEFWVALKGVVFRVPWRHSNNNSSSSTSAANKKNPTKDGSSQSCGSFPDDGYGIDDDSDANQKYNNGEDQRAGGAGDGFSSPSSSSRTEDWSPTAIPTKNYNRAVAGRRFYYRTVLCPLQSGFDITPSFLTAPGRQLDPAVDLDLDSDDLWAEMNLDNSSSSDEDDDDDDEAYGGGGGGGDMMKGHPRSETQMMLDSINRRHKAEQRRQIKKNKKKHDMSPLAQSKAAFKRPCREHINRVMELFLHDFDVVGELVECEQPCNPWWF